MFRGQHKYKELAKNDLRLAKGRYGTVYKGEYKTQFVAVKKFHTKEEDSWKREVELYNTQSLAHTNILRFIAADNRDNGVAVSVYVNK